MYDEYTCLWCSYIEQIYFNVIIAKEMSTYKLHLLHNRKKINPLTWFYHIQPIRACKDHSVEFLIHRIILEWYFAMAVNNQPTTRTLHPTVWRSYADVRHWSTGRRSPVGRTVRTVLFAGGHSYKSYGIGLEDFSSWPFEISIVVPKIGTGFAEQNEIILIAQHRYRKHWHAREVICIVI